MVMTCRVDRLLIAANFTPIKIREQEKEKEGEEGDEREKEKKETKERKKRR